MQATNNNGAKNMTPTQAHYEQAMNELILENSGLLSNEQIDERAILIAKSEG